MAGRRTVAEAAASFDVWALGMLLFEMCAGRNLFAQDTANDELTDSADVWWDMPPFSSLQPFIDTFRGAHAS